ncbi:purine and uridine phosphorylase [Corynespora cassiicola Philippines]|uniref:Purine and uridine phosphorylase n=1 Tax=Corynespora cassiicola Philippines TaxID=1448308 RepID=A0A2T2N1D6_CORCC|nr:purine and uridine phosphorylase [Corynespora cassiicola Philippines]
MSQQKRGNGDYTVGWICAITTEYVAAQAFLDEKHGRPEHVHSHDNNDYTLGRIGQHNVVVAVLPEGEYGTSSAAVVARDMLHSFPNVRIGLMVGIGGGAPSSKHDIRLGDIVVSAPRDGKGGVFQYDFGKTIQEQSFRPTGFLNQPPTALRTAMGGLKAEYESDGHQLDDAVNGVLGKKPRLKRKYQRPGPDTDKLYLSGMLHPTNDEANCAEVCGGDPSKLVPRNARTEEDDNPAVHYGIVASANQLMKDALLRDKFAKENGVLCFEMEAAGLMNHFPCLVIRGICDYSDTHKNKDWQGYAAMTAAAYAKDLLNRIPVNKVEAERRISDVLSDLREVAETHRDIAQQQLEIHQDQLVTQRDIVKQKLSDKQNECLQLFRLTKNTEDITYEWYKDRVEDRVEDTCMWFLNHPHFQEWSKQDSGPLLVSADPGGGKSVLAKHLIDHALPRSATLCYFFFKDQDQNTVRQALCALLHQLFSQKSFLIQHAMKHFEREGPGLINSSNSLWAILGDAVKDSQAGSIIIVLDALDECAESEFENMMRNVESQMRGDQLGYRKLKYLLTSRPYEQIVSKFRGLLDAFPRIHIPGEEESETISQEVNRVIEFRVERLAREKGLSDTVKNHLTSQLLAITHRTYLWVYLVFDYLKTESFKKTVRGVQSSMKTLPKNINQAYERILNKSKEHVMVRKALSIILAAGRPLTLSEMNLAVNIDESLQTIDDLDIEEEHDFKSRLRSWCGLFVSVHHGKIYFLHQTAREFLLANLPMPNTIPIEPQWQRSITIHQAHNTLAEVCVRYLNLFNSDTGLLAGSTPETHRHVDNEALLDYSARFWGLHFRGACIKQDDAVIVSIALRVSDTASKAYSAWSTIYWRSQYMTNQRGFTSIIVAAYLGHWVVVKRLLAEGAYVNAQGGDYGNALQSALARGHKDIVELLVKAGADVNAQGHKDIVELLVKAGADVNAQGGKYGNALQAASARGHKDIVELLRKAGAT